MRGFSMIEMAIALVIIGIVGGVSITLGSMQLEQARIKSTVEQMTNLEQALIQHLALHGRLPCPSSLTAGPSTEGREEITTGASAAICNAAVDQIFIKDDILEAVYMGAVPFHSLNLGREASVDAWGNRIAYVVQRSFINSDITNDICADATAAMDDHTNAIYLCFRGQSSGSANAGNADLNILQSNQGYAVTEDAVFILISHGANGFGAFQGQSIGRNALPANNSAERDNTNCPLNAACGTLAIADSNFVYDEAGGGFDDIVHFSTRNQLVARCNQRYANSCASNFGIDIR